MGAMASQPHDYSTVYSRRRSKETSKLRVTGPCAGNSPVTGEFPAQMASNAENVFIWWRLHISFNSHVGFASLYKNGVRHALEHDEFVANELHWEYKRHSCLLISRWVWQRGIPIKNQTVAIIPCLLKTGEESFVDIWVHWLLSIALAYQCIRQASYRKKNCAKLHVIF